MRYHWEYPVKTRCVQVAECETCECDTIVLLAPVLADGTIVGTAVSCSECFVILNNNRQVHVNDMAGEDLYNATGCRMVPHWNRYNVKARTRVADWMEMRWRRV